MANPREKRFVIFMNCDTDLRSKIGDFIENKMGASMIDDPSRYMHWLRTMGGNMYVIGTLENTRWNPNKIIDAIKKNIEGAHSIIAFDISNSTYQGLMNDMDWKFFARIQDLTKFINNSKRFRKLTKIKELIKKQEELKRKEILLKGKEKDLFKKKEMIDQEAELIRKELELKLIEDEIKRKEEEILKNK